MSEGLNQAWSNVNKKYGVGSVMKLSDKPLEMGRLKTDIPELDEILGGGIPFGRIIEIYGVAGGGKTTISLYIAKAAQKYFKNKKVLFADAEHSLNPDFAKKVVGINLDEMLIAQPDYGEQTLDIVEEFIRSGDVSVVIVDSVAALTPKAEIEGEMESQHIGRQARMMGQALRKLVAITSKTGTIVIFINQLRQKVGVMFGPTSVTPGGNALKFYSSIRLEVTYLGKEKHTKSGKDIVTGQKTKLETKKNKTFPPFKKAEIILNFSEGLTTTKEEPKKEKKKK